MKLTGKVALVTNVTHFMGPAITEEFAREGATLALHDRDAAGAERIAGIAERLGRTAIVLAGDLARSAEADRVVGEVMVRFGQLDVLVNNNAYPPSGRATESLDDEVWRAMMEALLDEPFYCLRAALRVMRPARRGKIINMSSAAAFPGLPRYAAYTAARAGSQWAHPVRRPRGGPRWHPGECHRPELRGEPHVLPARADRGPEDGRAHGQATSRPDAWPGARNRRAWPSTSPRTTPTSSWARWCRSRAGGSPREGAPARPRPPAGERAP